MATTTTARRRFTRPVPVSVNGVALAAADIARETQHHPSPDPDETWTMAARALAIRELLSQEAERLGIEAEPIEDDEGRRETAQEARLRALIEQEVPVPRADEPACRRYFDANRARFRSRDLFEAAHILLVAPTRDAKARAELREKAGALIAFLQDVPSQFESSARGHSACPSARQGGNLGQISPGQTVSEFEAALRAMTPGRIHPEPVETRYGFHVVRLDRRIDGEPLPFEAVRGRIALYLEEAVRRRAQRQYVLVLAGRNQVSGVDLNAAAGPLVQ